MTQDHKTTRHMTRHKTHEHRQNFISWLCAKCHCQSSTFCHLLNILVQSNISLHLQFHTTRLLQLQFPTAPVSYTLTLTAPDPTPPAPVPYKLAPYKLSPTAPVLYNSSSLQLQITTSYPLQLQFHTIHVPYISSSRTIQQQWHTTKVPYGFSSLQLKLTAFSVPNNYTFIQLKSHTVSVPKSYTFIQLKSHTISETYSSSSLQLNIPASSGKYRPSSLNLQTNTDPVP